MAFRIASRQAMRQASPIILKHQQKIAGIIVGHDHLASFIRWEKIPVIVSGAVFQSIPARGVNYQIRNESVRTLGQQKRTLLGKT